MIIAIVIFSVVTMITSNFYSYNNDHIYNGV